ncbi:MAG: molybdenum cofactor biosynthesis protein MoaE [Verrucomicrobia bacterium]|nr:molybdenum cofactor biosynthesis protein MoaE [Verrucomicrobiota bacterium]
MTNNSIRVSLTEDPIPVVDPFEDERLGADLRFLGVVRGVEGGRKISGIRYSAYPEMAERTLRKIVDDFQNSVSPHPVIIVHRIGFVAAGEPSIVIALGQPHSAAAFDLLASYLRRIKEDVPIWKHPVFADETTNTS